ncbi:MAG: hypothetical protein ABIR67_12770 [Gaiellaceae bacterium]
MRDSAQSVDPAVAEALVVPRQPMSIAEACRYCSTFVGDSFTSPSAPSVPNWLTISAATPAACGEAIDVPWMQM